MAPSRNHRILLGSRVPRFVTRWHKSHRVRRRLVRRWCASRDATRTPASTGFGERCRIVPDWKRRHSRSGTNFLKFAHLARAAILLGGLDRAIVGGPDVGATDLVPVSLGEPVEREEPGSRGESRLLGNESRAARVSVFRSHALRRERLVVAVRYTESCSTRSDSTGRRRLPRSSAARPTLALLWE